MSRKLGGGKLVIATHNAGKLREIAALLAPYGLECISAGSLGLPEPAETGRKRSGRRDRLPRRPPHLRARRVPSPG